MNPLLAQKKSLSSLSRKQLEVGSVTPSDQKPREIKSIPYQDPCYETVLVTKGSYIGKYKLGTTDTNKSCYRTLLETKQLVPNNSLFCDNLFEETCKIV